MRKDEPQGPEDWQLQGTSRMTAKQQRMMNAVCGCLEQIHWHGANFDKDSWRHFFSAVSAGQTMHMGWNYGDGRPRGLIMLGKSSLSLTRTQAADAITMAIHFGDHPDEQGVDARPVRWSDAVLRGIGWNPADLRGNDE